MINSEKPDHEKELFVPVENPGKKRRLQGPNEGNIDSQLLNENNNQHLDAKENGADDYEHNHNTTNTALANAAYNELLNHHDDHNTIMNSKRTNSGEHEEDSTNMNNLLEVNQQIMEHAEAIRTMQEDIQRHQSIVDHDSESKKEKSVHSPTGRQQRFESSAMVEKEVDGSDVYLESDKGLGCKGRKPNSDISTEQRKDCLLYTSRCV